MNTLSTLFNRSLLISTLTVAAVVSTPVMAEGGSAHHSGQASKHSVLGVGHGASSGAKVASAVVAAPVVVVGGLSLATGSLLVSAGDSVANSSQNVSTHKHRHGHGPLVVTDIVITADPAPNQVAKTHRHKQTKSETTTTTTTKTLKEVKQTTVEKGKR
jgi:hypothetical protein